MKRLMFMKAPYLALIATVLLLALGSCAGKPVAQGPATAGPAVSPEVKKPQAQVDENSAVGKALKDSGKRKKFLVVLFYDKDDENTVTMKKVFAEAESKFGKEKANFVAVNAALKEERSAVQRYEIDRAKKPAMVVLSPEGVIIRGFMEKVSLSQIQDSFISEKVFTFLKSAQERKLVFVCFPGRDPGQYEKILKEVTSCAGKRENSVVISVNPEDKNDAPFYSMFKMKQGANPEAVVTILNRGVPAGTLKGAVDRKKIEALLAHGGGCPDG